MKLVLSILFRGAVVMSAVVCAGGCVMWVRSHVVRDYGIVWVGWPGDSAGRRYLKLDGDSGGGQVDVSWKVWTDADRQLLQQKTGLGASVYYYRSFDEVPRIYARSYPPTVWNAVGFKWFSGPTHSSVCFPYWLVAMVSVVGPAGWVVARLRRRRWVRKGRCLGCGYDLRATPERCPECGMANGVQSPIA